MKPCNRMPKGLFYLLSPTTYMWMLDHFRETFLLLPNYILPSASPGPGQADVQPAFLLRRDRGTQAGAGSLKQMTGRCAGATAS